MPKIGFFSEKQQQVSLRMDGAATFKPVMTFDRSVHYVPARERSMVAFVYEGATPSEIAVVTAVNEDGSTSSFDDAIALGPLGEFLHAFGVRDPYPIRPMILDRSRLDDLKANRLSGFEIAEGVERAMERNALHAAPAP